METTYDYLIIGSGAGGSAAAYRLASAGKRVLLLEKGKELPRDGSTLDVQQVVHRGVFRSKEPWLDRRGKRVVPEEYFNLGGKTKWYGAALLRFGADEFQADTAHQCLPWPIGYEELAPYYDEAETLLGVRRFAIEPDLRAIVRGFQRRHGGWRAQPLPLGLSADILNYPEEAKHFDGFASVRKLKSDAESALLDRIRAMPNLTVLTGHGVQALIGATEAPKRIAAVMDQESRLFRAHTVLLAAGALHSPRLLQRYMEVAGLAGQLPGYRLVGRYLKLHLLTAMLAISTSRKTDVLRKTVLLLNPKYPHSSVQPLGFDGELIGTLLPGWVPRRLAAAFGQHAYGFFLQTEDGSDANNRVVTAGDRVTDGHPQLDFDEARLPAAHHEHRQLVRGLQRRLLGLGYLSFVKRVGPSGTAHACGTLVAGHDPAASVVDAYGKVHGMENLYVVDGSVLPRSSRENPALTIYAWSLRVAQRLAHRGQSHEELASREHTIRA